MTQDSERFRDVVLGVIVMVLAPLAIVFSPFYLAYKAFRTVIGLPIVEERLTQKHHRELYEAAKNYHRMSDQEFGTAVLDKFDEIPEPLLDPFISTALKLYEAEDFYIPPPPPVANSLEGARYRDLLAKAPDMHRAARVVSEVFREFMARVPPEPDPDDLAFDGRVGDIASGDLVEAIALPFFSAEVIETGLFPNTRRQLERNLHEVSKLPYTLDFKDHHKLILPTRYEGSNVAFTYLKNTPLLQLFDAPMPFSVPEKARFEHCFIIGGSGHGKTTLLENMILHDLNDERAPSIVVVDSQGQLIPSLARLVSTLVRNPIIIDPRDNPALNIFDVNQHRLKRYGASQREQVYNHTLDTFSYLFNSLLGAQLTVRQTALFNNLIALMLALPDGIGRNATLLDLIRVMEKTIPAEYMPAVDTLDPIAKDFLTKDFQTSRYDQTKEEIRYRIQNILGNKTLGRLFLAPNNKIDFFTELNNGATILIDTTQAFLGKTNSSYLGRIAITIILNAIMERASTRGPHRPVYFFIDEAQEYFDKGIDSFLTQARKYKAGLTLATQDLSHIPAELRSSIFSNTSVKFAGGVSANDARALASDMRCDVDFLMSQKKLNFACYVRNHTSSAVSVEAKLGLLKKDLQLKDDTYDAFRKRNRERISTSGPTAADDISTVDDHAEGPVEKRDEPPTHSKSPRAGAAEKPKPPSNDIPPNPDETSADW